MSGDYADRVELCRIHAAMSEFPTIGLLDYLTLQLSMASEAERQTMISHRQVLKAHKPMIDRFFEQLYPGAILYNIFVTKKVIPEAVFGDFIAEIEDLLGWKLPSGL